MKTVKLVFLMTAAILLALVALQNQAPLAVNFLWLTGEVPGVILFFLVAVAGMVLGVTAALLVRRGARPGGDRK